MISCYLVHVVTNFITCVKRSADRVVIYLVASSVGFFEMIQMRISDQRLLGS